MPADILIVPNRNSTTLNPNIQFSGSAVNTVRLEAQPSGSVAFVGNSGSLFSIVDSMSGSLMAVSDVSGLPILEVFSDDRVVMGKFNSNTLVVTGSRVGVGTATPSYALDVVGSATLSAARFRSSQDYQIILSGDGTQWAGIGFTDSSATDYMWYNGQNGTFAIGGVGSNVSGKKLHVNGGMSVGTLLDSSAVPSNGLYVEGSSWLSGNVAIGKTSPVNAKLDVNGNTIITGSLRVSGSNYDWFNGMHFGNGTGTNIDTLAIGRQSMVTKYKGVSNTCIGAFTGTYLSTGSNNTFVGYAAGYGGGDITGNDNVIIGHVAGNSITTANNNIIIGVSAAGLTNGGYYNTVIGNAAQSSYELGNYNTIIGSLVDVGTVNNTIAIGDGQGNVRYYVNSSGNTAIGKTSNINAKLDVSGNTIISGSLTSSGSAFVVGGGKLIIGSNTAQSFGLSDTFQILSTGATAGVLARYANNANGARWVLAKSRSTTIGGNGAVSAGDNLGRVSWYADNGSAWVEGASLFAENVASDAVRSRIVFQPGKSGVGLTTVLVADEYGVQITGSLDITGSVKVTSGSMSVGSGIALSTVDGELRAKDNVVAYYTSDERFKTNIIKIDNALEKLNMIDGVLYDWNDTFKDKYGQEDGYFIRKQNSGVIAQQVEKVFPNVVANRENGYKAIRYELLVPLLIEGIKEQQVEIKTLKAELEEIKKYLKL